MINGTTTSNSPRFQTISLRVPPGFGTHLSSRPHCEHVSFRLAVAQRCGALVSLGRVTGTSSQGCPHSGQISLAAMAIAAYVRVWPVALARECPQSHTPSQRLEVRSRNRTVYPNNRPIPATRSTGQLCPTAMYARRTISWRWLTAVPTNPGLGGHVLSSRRHFAVKPRFARHARKQLTSDEYRKRNDRE